MELIFIEDVYKKYNLPESFATIGMFDGVHLGHKKLINELICSSKNEKKSSMLITFREHPDYILNKRNNNGYLTEFDEITLLCLPLAIHFLKYLMKILKIF